MKKKTSKTAEKHRQSRKRNPPTGKRWKPGQSGNAAGRPKKERCLADLLNRFGEEIIERRIHGKRHMLTRWEALALEVWEAALRGQSWAVQFVAERTEGKVSQGLEILTSRDRQLLEMAKRADEMSDEELQAIVAGEGLAASVPSR